MLVKYIGKVDTVVTEYNGKKYCFSKSKPIQEIPVEVYNDIQQSRAPFMSDLLPVYEEKKETKTEKSIEEELDELADLIEIEKGEKDDVKSKTRSNTRKSSRPSKDSA